MTLIALPAGFTFVDVEWSLDVPAQSNRSAFTSRRKVVGLPGAETWSARVTVESITTELDERKWRAFLMQMRGVQNVVDVPVLDRQYTYPATGAVLAGAGDAYTCPIGGMRASVKMLEAGQFVTIILPSGHHRMVCLSADLVTEASGNATAQFEPALGEIPATASVVELDKPYARMNFVERRQGWRTSDGVTQIVLDFEEAL